MTERNTTSIRKPKSRFKKILISLALFGLAFALSIFIAFKLSPWPSALLIRYVFDKEGVKVNAALERYVPRNLTALLNERYDRNANALLDVYSPSSAEQNGQELPAIIWIHGGGWIAGSKDQVANYCKILAAKGYVVIAIEYSLAPGKTYPLPLLETNKALKYLVHHSKRLHIDTTRFVLAGDSGGAHIAAQMANMIAAPAYAAQLEMKPALRKEQLSGVLLYCGPYSLRNINLEGGSGQFLKTVLWSYSGARDFLTNPRFASASVLNYVDRTFPPTFISVGNGDPLAIHSQQLAQKLNGLGVAVDSLFFQADYMPSLPHEYQFDLSTDAGRLALERSLEFLAALK